MAETNHEQYEVIRLALVSPSDVPRERKLVNEVIADLNTNLATRFGFVLELHQWEDVYPALHAAGPQGHIDTKLNIAECDYVVGILWHRFGTPMPSGETGTEHEVRQAYALWQKHQRPQVMLYVNKEPYSPSTTAELSQWEKVLKFKEEFQPKGVVHDYPSADDFSRRLRNHLTLIIAERVNARGSNITALQCIVSSSVQTVRAEGISELISEISLLFPLSPIATPLACNIDITLNTTVTNRLEHPSNVLVGSFLHRRNKLSTYEVKGRCTAANRIVFENVLLDLRGLGGTCEYRVVGIRANAHMIGFSLLDDAAKPPDVEPTLIAFVQIQGVRGELFDVVTPAVYVGTIKPSTQFEIASPVPDPLFSRKTGINAEFARSPATVSPNVNLWVRFTERYPGVFSTADEESRYVRELGQDRTGVVGARLWVCFSLLPDSTKLYATTRDRESAPDCEDTILIRADENGQGSYEPISASSVSTDGSPIASIAVLDGKACAAWEWISTKPASSAPRSLTFGFVFSALPESTLVGKTLISGGLAPLGRIPMESFTTSTTAPVPRFVSLRLPQVAFNVVWE